MTTKIYLKLK